MRSRSRRTFEATLAVTRPPAASAGELHVSDVRVWVRWELPAGTSTAPGQLSPSWKHDSRVLQGAESSGQWSLRLRSERLLSPTRHGRSSVQARST